MITYCDSDMNILADLAHEHCAGHCWECEQCLGDQGHEVVEFITPPTVGERSTVLSWCLDCAEELEIS